MKKKILLFALLLVSVLGYAAPRRKIIEDGGSGQFKAEAVSERTLPGFVVYKPQNMLAAVEHEGPLPLLVFANGGCNDTSIPHEKMLNDLASYGYVVIALGEMQERLDDRELHKSPNEDMKRAIDWAERQTRDRNSEYYRGIDMEYVALGGQSCGGAQVLANCADKRVKTYLMFNSGIGNMEMSGATKADLKNLHGPILYIIGGEGDVAYQNAIVDYENISHVPVAFANHLRVGHGGSFHEPFGGSFSRMARMWLSWQFKDQRQNIDVFLRNSLNGFPDWTMKARNFPPNAVNDPYTVQEYHLQGHDGRDVWGQLYLPNTPEEKKPLVIMLHGFNGTHEEPQHYAACLAMRGVASYVVDMPDGSMRSKSGGTTLGMTVPGQVEHITAIAREIAQMPYVDRNRIALLGCSQGGLVTALAVGANPDLFKAAVFVYPAFGIPQTADRMLQQFDAANGAPQNVMGIQLSRDYYASISGLDVPASVAPFQGPSFIVYGDKDGIASGDILSQVSARLNKPQTLVIPGGDHGFSNYLHHAQATEGIVSFVTRALSAPRGAGRRFAEAAGQAPVPDVHDPVMAYENGRYYMFTTGFGIGMMSSDDMIHWKPEKAPLDPIPAWAHELVPAYNGHTWAPDIQKVGDRWYLYYSCSTFYQNISVIGVATNKTLDPGSPDYKWEDLGKVIQSQPRINDFNAIDPCLILDRKGTPWLTFGSFWDGIQLVQLGKDMKTPVGKPKTIARRRNPESVAHNQPTANSNAIEAPFITYRDGYYYLFVSFDYCCKGISSNYKTAVGRSKSVTGPYLDMKGRPMTQTGGTIILGENDRYSGVGHCGVYEMGGKWYIIAHGYDKQQNGASKLFLRQIRWDNGWPTVIIDE